MSLLASSRQPGHAPLSWLVVPRRQAERLREELALVQDQAAEELRFSRRETIERLGRAIQMHDAETGRHVNRIATLAALLARRFGLEDGRVALLGAAAPMREIGKVAISDAILRKAGPLSDEERAEMERHTLIGHQILAGSSSELLQMAAQIALCHHERWDGNGYPRGLAGEAIPLEARIVAVADVFDALLSNRCYRLAMALPEVRGLIKEGRGSHFDPQVLDALLADLGGAAYRRGHPGAGVGGIGVRGGPQVAVASLRLLDS